MREELERRYQSDSHHHVAACVVADVAARDSDIFSDSADADIRNASPDSASSRRRYTDSDRDGADSGDDDDRAADTDPGPHGAADSHGRTHPHPEPDLELPDPVADLPDADVSSEPDVHLPDPDPDLSDADVPSQPHFDLPDSDALRIRIRTMKLPRPRLAASFVLLLLSVAPEVRAKLPFVEDDYARALEQARARNVPIFLEAWAPW
jgi:hypothetical protein